jgi:hypothetical protein
VLHRHKKADSHGIGFLYLVEPSGRCDVSLEPYGTIMCVYYRHKKADS